MYFERERERERERPSIPEWLNSLSLEKNGFLENGKEEENWF